MDKKKTLIVAVIGALLVGSIILVNYLNNAASQKAQPQTTASIRKDSVEGFELVAKYLGNSSWEYVITSQLPDPCTQVQVETLVAESYPEQVTIKVTVEPPSPSVMCVQMITDYNYQGNFTASEQATVKLSVENMSRVQ